MQRTEVRDENQWRLNFAARSQDKSNSRNEHRGGRQVWRRRKLTKKDDLLRYKLGRVPFLEEQVRMIKDTGRQLSGDIERLLLFEENKFAFVNEIAAEAKQYVDNNRDEYGAKKAIFHVLSNRMNEAGYSRPEAYMEPDPYKPGPGYMRDELIV
ncbi:hypothetical protein LguiA_031787 [Lonicera macranthoides]